MARGACCVTSLPSERRADDNGDTATDSLPVKSETDGTIRVRAGRSRVQYATALFPAVAVESGGLQQRSKLGLRRWRDETKSQPHSRGGGRRLARHGHTTHLLRRLRVLRATVRTATSGGFALAMPLCTLRETWNGRTAPSRSVKKARGLATFLAAFPLPRSPLSSRTSPTLSHTHMQLGGYVSKGFSARSLPRRRCASLATEDKTKKNCHLDRFLLRFDARGGFPSSRRRWWLQTKRTQQTIRSDGLTKA